MSKTKWFSGQPPSVGWWPASSLRSLSAVRWWNGVHWSWACYLGMGIEDVARCSAMQSHVAGIEWRHRPKSWPARSRT